ncbi:uncharacterized protein EI90DRAFT_2050372 [Cantharellus anzutake]|uniref:uncharacterized protein n=1 Tax=Cantharellus anzutake TaxID=1750568 RepID=UPI001907E85B|nr:uncharacterized protein EI90DRAFT_2050372 [Cantharellus anzutake]KAF8340337.1 hypothetical protein EI90DRAFT_2050372 [Cantharellus anzutake]
MKVDYSSFSQAERTKFEHSFTNLLRLEEFGSEIHNNDEHSMSDDAIKGLYPLQALVQPIAARFKFHFEGPGPPIGSISRNSTSLTFLMSFMSTDRSWKPFSNLLRERVHRSSLSLLSAGFYNCLA